MADEKKLKVLTPVTVNGNTLAYDADKNPIYRESIVELAAKKDFEALNAKLPEHLKHKLEIINLTEEKTSVKDVETATNKKRPEEKK